MKIRGYITAVSTIMFLFAFSCHMPSGEGPHPDPSQIPPDSESVPNEIIIKIGDSLEPEAVARLADGVITKLIGRIGAFSYYVVRIADAADIDARLAAVNKSGLPVHAEKNYIYRAFLAPNDPFYTPCQYAPQKSGCESAWDTYTGSNETIVAVLDTGVNGAHEDLEGRVIGGYNCVANSAVAAGANSDDNGHGTHVAGIIGAQGDNSKGIAGVAWQSRILPVKVLDSAGNGTTANIAEGILWAADYGSAESSDVDVINMSLGGPGCSMSIGDAVNYAVSVKQITVVVAMGNDGRTAQNYPAAYPGVIAVGSTNGRDSRSSYSTTGNFISVSAPGENIFSLSSTSNTGYIYMSGTSMASPFVAGVAALLNGKDAALTPAEIKSMIEDAALASADLGSPGYDSSFGWGRVDVAGALAMTAPYPNHYGTIKVVVNNKGTPKSGVEVLLLDSGGTQTIQIGITSDGITAGGTDGQAVFSFTRAGSYLVSALIGSAQSQQPIPLLEAGTETTVTFNFNIGPDYLLVDDDNYSTFETYYQNALSSISGITYDTWNVGSSGSPSTFVMASYDGIIWFTGSSGLDSTERDALSAYLDDGGKLFITGQEIGYLINPYLFFTNYLHATYIRDDTNTYDLTGADLMDGVSIVISGGDGANNQNYPDEIGLGSGAVGIFDYAGTYTWGGLRYSGTYKVVYLSFGFEAINSAASRNLVMQRILEWLNPS